MAYEQHLHSARGLVARCAVITLSDTRTPDTDSSGKRITELLIQAGHQRADYRVIPDDPDQLKSLLQNHLAHPDIDAILTTGGTGISRRDQTIGVIEKLLDYPLPGFGELFRKLSYDQIGSGAIASRAIAGVAKAKLIFAMPGSTKAVDLAMTQLILPELAHLIIELRK